MIGKFYEQIAEAFGTTIESTYIEQDDIDAGADFANGYNVQISPYLPQPYSLWKSGDGEVFTMVTSTKTQKSMIEKVKQIKGE